MIGDLLGRVAVVTGAASGIGRAMAERFAAEGMRVVMADVERPALEEAAGALGGAGAEVLAVPTDVSDPDQVDALARAAVDAFGAVDVVCNNAGVGGGGQLWEVPLGDWRWVLGVNLWGVIHGIRSFVPLLVDQDEGHVVNTASMAGLTSPPFMGPYNVSKHAVVTLSETLHAELAMRGSKVGVTVLCPGWVNTRIAESDRNRPAELAAEQPAAGPDREAIRGVLRTFLAAGMDPADVAAQVVDAVRTGRFYLLTHEEWSGMVEQRLRAIAEGGPPAAGGLPPV
ncbi:MAG TPA: SDR family NAD(P)-dependent oxidoreductase [Acidimicrobiales bacterium]